MKKPPFVNGEIYHVFNRGVEKRKIFQDDSDRFRFIHDLFEFNDTEPVLNINYRFNKNKKSMGKSMEVQPPYIRRGMPRELTVEILAFCLMTNHFHLLVRQRIDKGIVNFMQKLGTGYTMYFNQKHQRVGPLFQGRFKAVLVNKDSHFVHLPYYIHLNPLETIMPNWKEEGVTDFNRAVNFLESYRWSSYLDYIGKKNFPSLTQRDFLLEFFGSCINYKQKTTEWLKQFKAESFEEIKNDNPFLAF